MHKIVEKLLKMIYNIIYNKYIILTKEKVMNKIKGIFKKIISYKEVQWILLALCLNLICDILNQRSIIEAVMRMFTKPLNFIYNSLLILITIAFCNIFKKRKFAISICLLLWLAVAITNFVVQSFRNTPFSFIDLIILPVVFSAFNNYLNIFEVLLIILLIVSVIVGLVFLYKKEKAKERLIKHTLITGVVVLALLFCAKTPFVKVGAISDDYNNLTKAYEEYGLPYCFVSSVVTRGVDKIEEYDEIIVDEVVQNIEIYNKQLENNIYSEYTVESDIKPNVIFLQLESFMDANNLIDLEYSKNPTPVFSYLKENYPSGVLTVPSVGAGTANVEFEIMTGCNLEHFSAGEYPYKTVVNKMPMESIAYLLKEEGYSSTVIHNNRASFYDRELVFTNMGYDRFVSAETMINLGYTPNGWYKDDVLFYEIFKAMEYTNETDFIYTIGVQPHGKYLEDLQGLDLEIDVMTDDEEYTPERINKFKYYVNQLYEVDLMLKELVMKLESYKEPTMLVIYGDHLPTLDLTNEDVLLKDLYNSEYVIYTNYETNLKDKNLYSYQLSSHVLQSINCDNGIINKINQTRLLNKNYQNDLNTIIYDIIEGKQYIYNENNIYKPTNMVFGYNDISITDVTYELIEDDEYNLIIKGINLNECSVVFINNKKYETEYIDSNTLKVNIKTNDDKIYNICVKQMYMNSIYNISNTIELNFK